MNLVVPRPASHQVRPVFYLGLVAALIVAVLFLNRSTQFSPGDDAAVHVLTSDPIRVDLGSDPTLDEVTSSMRAALLAAAGRDIEEALAEEMRFIAGDEEYLNDLSANGLHQLRTEAAALAFSNHSVFGDGNDVTIISLTIELLPMGFSEDINRRHEDGHAHISSNIAQLCASAVVAAEVEEGMIGDELVGGIIDHLHLLEEQAHSQYHVAVSDGASGSHLPAAQMAVAGVVDGGCVARSGGFGT